MTARSGHAHPRRILMTVDAIGGVWRYAMDLAAGLKANGIETIFAVLGPPPSQAQIDEAMAIGGIVDCDAPLDWVAETGADLQHVPRMIRDMAVRHAVDLVHLNLPSQAAGLDVDVPVVVVSHSCVPTWFQVVRGGVPGPWQWHTELNRQGFRRADAIVAPSRSHAAMLKQVYGDIDRLHVVHNASRVGAQPAASKQDIVFAAGRWWDDGKNGAVLDAAAADIRWPVIMGGANRGPNGQFLAIEQADHRGELSHAETMKLMANAAIFVSPSVYEPFGLAALEAARCACAMVLVDIPTYRELWDGTALFADPADPASFSSAINRLSRDTALRALYAQRARMRSLDFTTETQVEAMAHLYARCLSSSQTLTAAE